MINIHETETKDVPEKGHDNWLGEAGILLKELNYTIG